MGKGWEGPGRVVTTFLGSKRKRGKERKRERVSKQKLLKGCHQGQNVTALAILERLEFKIFFVGQPWWPTILFSVTRPLHFKIHFAGPESHLEKKRNKKSGRNEKEIFLSKIGTLGNLVT